jgi:hypothetical protein
VSCRFPAFPTEFTWPSTQEWKIFWFFFSKNNSASF